MLKRSPLKNVTARRALKAARRHADEQLLASKLASPRLAWRSAELLTPEHRIDIARSLTDTVRAADERLLPSASPLDRAAVRECRAQLLDLAAHLFDLDRSVTPRGMLLLERLLSDPRGPLYGSGESRRLRVELRNVRETLTT